MKVLLKVLLLTVISLNSFGLEKLPLSNWTRSTDREDVFILTSFPQVEVTLDCGSFLFGITVKSQQRSQFLMLYESECYSIYDSLRTWFSNGEQACLKVDFIKKDWDLSKTTYDCQ